MNMKNIKNTHQRSHAPQEGQMDPLVDTSELPQNQETRTSVDAFIDRYTPLNAHPGQWKKLRPEIIALVRRHSPQSSKQATNLFGALAPLLSVAENLHFEGSLGQLLTEEWIERTTVHLNSLGSSNGRIQNVRRILLNLHQILHNLPPTLLGKGKQRKASDPISPNEISMIVKSLAEPSKALHLHLARRLIMALGAGLIGQEADKAGIYLGEGGISSIIDSKGNVRPLTKKWISQLNMLATPDLELYKLPNVQATIKWLRENSLSFLWARLRDEWLLEQLDGTAPAFVQFKKAGVTEYDLDRIVLRWNQIPFSIQNNSLRNRAAYHQIDCAPDASDHPSGQHLSIEELDGEPKIAMDTITRGKISKAQSRRMSAANLATIVATPKTIPGYHQKIIGAYTCKSAPESDRAQVHAAFTCVMERASHILSVALSQSLLRCLCPDCMGGLHESRPEVDFIDEPPTHQ
jgi:hypothetical protein